MNALSGNTPLLAEVDGKYGIFTLKELFELHNQGRAIKVPALLNERGNIGWVEVGDVVSFGKQNLKRITHAASRLFVELSEDAIIPAYSSELFRGREKQINLKLKHMNELKVTKDLGLNNTILLTTRIPLNLPEGDQKDYEYGFVLGFFSAEGNFEYRKHKNTKHSFIMLKTLARKNGMSLEEYQKYMTDVQRVVLSVGQSDFERKYVDILQKHFKFSKLLKVSENAYYLYSSDLSLIHLIKDYIDGSDSHTKHFKNEAYNRSCKFIEGVLDGFLSGDGTYDKKGDRFRVEITTNYQLYNDLIFLSKALGYDAHINNGRFAKSPFPPYKKVYHYLRLSIFKNWHRYVAFGLVKEHIKSVEVIRREAFNLILEPLYSQDDNRAKFNSLYFTAYGILVSDAVKAFAKPLLAKPQVLLK